jgi:hypothetical protein
MIDGVYNWEWYFSVLSAYPRSHEPVDKQSAVFPSPGGIVHVVSCANSTSNKTKKRIFSESASPQITHLLLKYNLFFSRTIFRLYGYLKGGHL